MFVCEPNALAMWAFKQCATAFGVPVDPEVNIKLAIMLSSISTFSDLLIIRFRTGLKFIMTCLIFGGIE